MPSSKRTLDRARLHEHVAGQVFGRTRRPDRFGMEIELFPVTWAARKVLPRPVRLSEPGGGGLRPLVEDFASHNGLLVRRPDGTLGGDRRAIESGHVTFEPGGQVEYSGSPEATPSLAYESTSSVVRELSGFLRSNGIDLRRFGLNPWHTLDEIGLQTRASRYRLMDAHFARLSPYGRRMMRQTATTHVNLDFGSADLGWNRWRAAQLLAPIALATFAHSPILEGKPTEWRSFRGRIWRDVDPGRCGFPALFLEDVDSDPADQFLDFALRATLFMLRTPDGWRAPDRPLTFARWMDAGHEGSFPDLEDWDYHLTTLFPEVRPRGFLELRSADNLPEAFASVPLTWWASLLCDERALGEVIERLAGTASRLPNRMVDAARDGLAHGPVAKQAREIYSLAQEASGRFQAGFFSTPMTHSFAVYGEQFVRACKTPADSLLDLFRRRGCLDYEGLEELHRSWCRLTAASPSSAQHGAEPA